MIEMQFQLASMPGIMLGKGPHSKTGLRLADENPLPASPQACSAPALVLGWLNKGSTVPVLLHTITLVRDPRS